MTPLFVTIPHSGRKIPATADWLNALPLKVLYCDVDAFVDELYQPALRKFHLTALVFPWHRYAVDANRLPTDRTSRTVEGSQASPVLKAPTEIHWHETTRGDRLIKKPLSQKQHKQLMDRYYHPFHHKIREEFQKRKAGEGKPVFHLDLHSMPSRGRALHRDPGQTRAQVVIGNREGASAEDSFTERVLSAYGKAGFETALNRPYRGGRITEIYGKPERGQNTLQVELNRSLYMDEETGQKSPAFGKIQKQLCKAMALILKGLETTDRRKSPR